MLPISDDTIDGLDPSDKRYDVPVAGDLHISVLPNGSKTWVLLNGAGVDQKRRSLGIYPEMSVLEACAAARHSKQSKPGLRETGADDPPSYVLKDGHLVTARSRRPVLVVGVVAGLAAVVASGWLVLETFRNQTAGVLVADSAALATGGPAVSPPANTDAIPQPDRAAGFGPQEDDKTVLEPSEGPVFEPKLFPQAELGDAVTETDPPTTSLTDLAGPPTATIATPTLTVPDNATTQMPSAQDTDTPDRVLPAAAQMPAFVDVPVDAGDEADPGPPIRLAEDTDAAPAAMPVAISAAESGDDGGVFAVASGNVARAQLTSAVSNREPMDDLGNLVAGDGADPQRVYFFTELRSMSGATVVHRWERDGVLQAEVPFEVGGWRWRVYSSKDILPDESGRWRVSVVDENGAVLADQPFEFIAGLAPE